MTTSESQLETQLEMLRSTNTLDSAQRVQDGIVRRTRQQRRQVIVASTGACVAAIGTLHFVLQDDPFGYFALAFTTIVLVFVAWRSAHQAVRLAALRSGASLLACWRAEVRTELRQTLITQLIALQFAAMTAWVIWSAGALNFKSSIFLIATAGVFIFAANQLLVVRPLLKRELDMLADDE